MKKILFVMFTCLFSLGMLAHAEDKKTYDIGIEIKIKCPMSQELQEFFNTIPRTNQDTSFEEWKDSFVANMTQLIKLVESEKVHHSEMNVKWKSSK